jgi:hypothetical protein
VGLAATGVEDGDDGGQDRNSGEVVCLHQDRAPGGGDFVDHQTGAVLTGRAVDPPGWLVGTWSRRDPQGDALLPGWWQPAPRHR